MPRKKKKYICKWCGKEYYGYRKGGYCSLECARAAQQAWNESMRNKTNPHYQKMKEIGEKIKRQIKRKRGKIYEKWRKGMLKALQSK